MAFTCEHMVEIEEAQKLERELADMKKQSDPYEREAAKAAINVLKRELAEAKETMEMLETRHGATMLCHQAQMDEITKQRDELAEALKSLCRAIISEEPLDITDLHVQSAEALAATKGGQYE